MALTIKATPHHIVKLLNNGIALHNKNRYDKAEKVYLNVLKKAPDNFDANYLLGTLYIQKSQHNQAIPYLKKAIELNPDSSISYNNLGISLKYNDESETAKTCFEKAITLDSNNSDAYINLGSISHENGDIDQAISIFNSSIKINDTDSVHFKIANAYKDKLEHEQAMLHFNKAIALNPNMIEAQNGLAMLYRDIGNLEQHYSILTKTINIPGDQTFTQWLMGLYHLSKGNYLKGWDGYSYGRKTNPPLREPVLDSNKEWHGQALSNKSILIYGEQGIGDVVMFLSCLPDLINDTKAIYICCDERLYPTINNTYSCVNTIKADSKDSLRRFISDNNIDYCAAAGELPHFLRKKPSDFPSRDHYLLPDLEKQNIWKKRFINLGNRPIIGLSWFGGKSYYDKINRSTKITEWNKLLHNLDASYINLQYGDCENSIVNFNSNNSVKIWDWKDSDPLNDLDDFIAKISALDLVITVDNSTAHIAGSLGIPTIVMLPQVADWRWLNNTSTTPWYNSVRLIRKQTKETWETCLYNAKSLANQQLSISNNGAIDQEYKKLSTNGVMKDKKYHLATDIIYEKTGNNCKNIIHPSCAVITPIGPGHTDIFSQCQQSIAKACSVSPGIFKNIIHIHIDDSEGNIGRSMARNKAIEYASNNNIDWLFFLDADDLMAPNAFEIVSLLENDFDAIWGKITSFEHKTNQVDDRSGQISETKNIHDIVINDPYNTLQMGHFVKTTIAASNLFNVEMNCGEDFDYYLRVWNRHRCIRTEALLFINRRGLHSSGPKSADARQWRNSVEKQLSEYCINNNLVTQFVYNKKNNIFSISNPFDIIQRQLMHGEYFELKELEFIKDYIGNKAVIVEVGANIGNHIIYYSNFMNPEKIIAIEPNPEAIKLLKINLSLNNITNVDMNYIGIGAGSKNARYRIVNVDNNLGASHLVEDTKGDIEVACLDNIIGLKIDFIKIDVEEMEIDVLKGCKNLLLNYRPAVLIEVMNKNNQEFQLMIKEMDYRVTKEFKCINAINYFIEAIN